MLVMAGCEVNATDERGMTPLMTALLRRQNGLAQYLISRGADVTAPNSNGRTPLHTAIVSGVDRAVIEAILSRRADVNAVDHAGITPLHMAIQTEQAEIAALLVEKGANVEAKTRDGLTPMDLARRNAKGDIMEMLSAKLKQIEDAKPKVAVVEPPKPIQPIEPPKPVTPPKPAAPAPMLKRIYLFLETASSGPGFTAINTKNTGMNTARVTIKVKTLYEDDYIETKERTITLDPMERRELSPVLFGYRLLTTVPPGTGRVTPRGVIPPEELMPHGKTLGIVVEAWVDGQRDNIVANPLSMLQKIKRIERDDGP
jgi:hypothetical protein